MESIQRPQQQKLSLGHAYNTKMELLKNINIYVATHMKVKVKSLI